MDEDHRKLLKDDDLKVSENDGEGEKNQDSEKRQPEAEGQGCSCALEWVENPTHSRWHSMKDLSSAEWQ